MCVCPPRLTAPCLTPLSYNHHHHDKTGGGGGAFLQAFQDSAFGTLPAEGLTMEAMLGALEDTR